MEQLTFCSRSGRQVSLQHLRDGLLVKVVSLGGDLARDQEPAAVELGLVEEKAVICDGGAEHPAEIRARY